MKAKISVPIKLLKAVAYGCSKDQTRYILQNVQVNFKKDRAVIVATNGRLLLAAVIEGVLHDLAGQSFLIPANLIKYVHESPFRKEVVVEIDEDTVILHHVNRDELSVSKKQCDGSYPNWKQVVPTGNLIPHSCPVSQEVTEVLFSAMAVFKNKNNRNLVGYCFENDYIGPHICHIDESMFALYMPTRGDDREMTVPNWLIKD